MKVQLIIGRTPILWYVQLVRPKKFPKRLYPARCLIYGYHLVHSDHRLLSQLSKAQPVRGQGAESEPGRRLRALRHAGARGYGEFEVHTAGRNGNFMLKSRLGFRNVLGFGVSGASSFSPESAELTFRTFCPWMKSLNVLLYVPILLEPSQHKPSFPSCI